MTKARPTGAVGEVGTVNGSDGVTRETSDSVKVWQFFSLPIPQVVNCARHAELIPKLSLAILSVPGQFKSHEF